MRNGYGIIIIIPLATEADMEIKNIRIIICTSDDSEMIKDGRQIKALANELNNKSNNAFQKRNQILHSISFL